MFKEKLLKHLKAAVKGEIVLEIPPDSSMGDYALACFPLAKILKKNPKQIAEDLAKELKKPDFVEEIKAVNGYVNFFIKTDAFVKAIIEKIEKEKKEFGKSKVGKENNVMVEFSAPNTNKPMHLGHIRTNLLGDCLCNLFDFQGYKSIRANLVNDRGIHICKSMLAYQKFGKGETPESIGMKGDHFVGKYYVLYQQSLAKHPELEEESMEMLKKWEQGDKAVIELWKKMRKWCMQGFQETYKNEGVKFDKIYYESDFWKKAREYVLACYKKGIFKKGEEGELYIDLEKEKLPNKTVLRADGTSLYSTQDIYLAQLKFTDYKLAKSIYVVAREQEMYFKQLFTILKIMGFSWWDKCIHYSYGMVNLPEGKMKSREGKVVDADDLLFEMEDLAKEEILKRHKDLKEEEIHERAHNIGLAALRFYMLKIDANKDMIFKPEEAIPFEGDTGPYMQYTHARTCSILKKAKENGVKTFKADYSLLKEPIERILIKKLGMFPEIASDACAQLRPHLVAQYLIELCRTFNEFYQICNCLKAEKSLRDSRLKLVQCTKIVLKNALGLLGIVALEEM